MNLRKLFNFKREQNPSWYLRVLWLRLMYWPVPSNNSRFKPKHIKWFSVRLQRGSRGRRLHFDIGPIEGFLAGL